MGDAGRTRSAAVCRQPYAAYQGGTLPMNGSLTGQRVLVIGRGSGTFLTGQTLHIDGGEPLT